MGSEKDGRVFEVLEICRIPYEKAEHDPFLTMEDSRRLDERMGVSACKNLLVMMPEKKFSAKQLIGQDGLPRLSFAGEEELEEYLRLSTGAVSILGLVHDGAHRVRLLVDADVLKTEFFVCHPCINTASLKMRTEDVFGRFLEFTGHRPQIVSL